MPAGTQNIELKKRPTKIIHITVGDRITKSEKNFFSEKVYKNAKEIFNNHSLLFTENVINTYSEKALHRTELANLIVKPSDITGRPTDFCLVGEKTIRFFPIPQTDMKYSVLSIDDIEELTFKDKSPLNTEFDDFLVEYATTRLAIGNEFDMTQEQMIMSNILQQIQQILMPPPAGCVTKGYW